MLELDGVDGVQYSQALSDTEGDLLQSMYMRWFIDHFIVLQENREV